MSWDGTAIGFPFAGDKILLMDIISTRFEHYATNQLADQPAHPQRTGDPEAGQR